MTTGSVTPLGREGRSPIIRRPTASFQLACGQLTAGAFVGHARPLDLRSARAWFLEIAALRPTPSRSRRLLALFGSGRRPATRRAENDQIRSLLALEPLAEPATRAGATPKGRSGARTPTDLIPPSRKRGGQPFGAALSEVALARTPTSSAGLATGQAMSRSPIGGSPVPGLAAALWCLRYALRGL